jgi:lactoylglutathione lyase
MKLSFVIIYVEDLNTMLGFYRDIFDLKVKLIHESGLYAELDTGSTTFGLSQTQLAESLVSRGYTKASLKSKPANIQISFEPADIKETIKMALDRGAVLVADAEVKPWGWESAMIRDPEGNLIELAREVS